MAVIDREVTISIGESPGLSGAVIYRSANIDVGESPQLTGITNYRPATIDIDDLPQLTGVTNYRPATIDITDSPYGDGIFPSSMAFDNIVDIVHRWMSNPPFTGSEWVKQDFGAGHAKTIVKYTLTNGGSSDGVIKDWTFEGSNDDLNWDILDTQTGQNPSDYTEYLVPNTTAYRYYRIVITAINSGVAASIWEMEMMEFVG
jgi:hypothetical protein